MNFRKNFFLFLLLNACVTPMLYGFSLNDDGEQELDEFVFDPVGMDEAGTMRGMPSIFAQFALGNVPDIPTAEEVLLTPFYKKTVPTRRRSILDNEIFQIDSYNSGSPFTFTPFFNFTTEACFNDNDTTVRNYLDLLQGDIPEKIENLITELMAAGNPGIDAQTVATFEKLNIPDVLELFNNIKIQEKQIGGMIRYIYDSNQDWIVDIRVPFIWQIYNFYLTPEEQANIEKQPLMALIGTVGDFMPFARAHLISDKIGIGDTQIRLETVMLESRSSSVSIGCSLGIPTAFAFKKGVYGSYFNKKTPTPDFELVRDIVQLIENNVDDIDNVKKNGENLGLAALDRFSSVVLDHPLGRDGHWTLGAYYKSTLDFTPEIQMLSSTGILCPLPGDEERFMKTLITRQEVTDTQALPVGTDPQATTALNKYNELILRKLFPQSYGCSIFPGVIFMSNNCITYTHDKWIFTVGSDMWAQTKERLLGINASNAEIRKLETDIILNDYAFQSKSYIRIDYHNPESSWIYTVAGGMTGISDRIGDSTTFSINIQRYF